MDIVFGLLLAFRWNATESLTIIDFQLRALRYFGAMRRARDQAFRRVQQPGGASDMRRLGDVVIACVLLALTFPLMVLVAVAVKWESPGPVLERQTCIARGRRFQMLQFRTTLYDPQEAMPDWARKPTQVGEFLRQTRIEALPRLINVIRGEMSITTGGGSPSFLD